MKILSTIVFNPDTTAEQRELVRRIEPLLHATRDDYIEEKILSRPHPDGGDETTIYVIVHTSNLLGFIADLKDENII